MEYIYDVPETVPAGCIVVHNHVIPRARPGDGGFRVWLDEVGTPDRVVCDCGWAPHLPEHYRRASVPDRTNATTNATGVGTA
jgi:hypothetical protein